MRRVLPLALLLLAGTTRAELWFPLESLVPRCAVIAKAKVVRELPDSGRELEITEVWIGSKELIRLNDAGHYPTRRADAGAYVDHDQEIVLFFDRNELRNDKVSRHACSFPITDGKLIYAATADQDREEFTVEAFKKRVLEITAAAPPPK